MLSVAFSFSRNLCTLFVSVCFIDSSLDGDDEDEKIKELYSLIFSYCFTNQISSDTTNTLEKTTMSFVFIFLSMSMSWLLLFS